MPSLRFVRYATCGSVDKVVFTSWLCSNSRWRQPKQVVSMIDVLLTQTYNHGCGVYKRTRASMCVWSSKVCASRGKNNMHNTTPISASMKDPSAGRKPRYICHAGARIEPRVVRSPTVRIITFADTLFGTLRPRCTYQGCVLAQANTSGLKTNVEIRSVSSTPPLPLGPETIDGGMTFGPCSVSPHLRNRSFLC